MARGDDARAGNPGGDGIQAQRPPRSRLIPAAGALAAAAALALHPTLSTDTRSALLASAGGLAVALLAAGLALRAPVAVAWSLLLLGVEYGVWLGGRGTDVDTRTPVYAAGLLLTAELAFDGLERAAARPEGEVVARRGLQLAGLALAAIVVSAVVLEAAAVPVGSSVGLTAVGVVAAVLALVFVARLATRAPAGQGREG